MASIKNLKKEILYTYGALLDQCYLIQMVFPKVDPEAAQALCQEIENAYSASLDKLSRQQEKNPAARAKAARKATPGHALYLPGTRCKGRSSRR